ncbi:tetratricopeptide repeat protein [Streptomyces sp. NPDC093586]|uniref:tetratricopeptide repeat protein n=1 Tax=Streptomyces sp. NPDC093586 TaxID=3366042 RepID=UPI00381A4CD5
MPMDPTATADPADRPGTGRTPCAQRDRTEPRGTGPHWYTAPLARPYGPRAAERFLRTGQDDPARASVLQAARVLLHTGHPRRTVLWCGKLHRRARAVEASGWESAFRALCSEALLHLGDLASAEREAASAQHAAGARNTSLWLWPTAILAEALIAQGRHEEATAHLGQYAPAPVWQNLPWLRAQGRLHLAAHRHHDALAAFRTVGRLASWEGSVRLPHLPWRTDTAEALLQLGLVDEARALLVEEVATVSGVVPRHQGIALRLLARTEEPGARLHTLARAVTALRRCENRLEHAHALEDLGRALDTVGENSLAAAFLRRATHLAADCGAPPPRDEMTATATGPTQPMVPARL